jgi:hypothetical protein
MNMATKQDVYEQIRKSAVEMFPTETSEPQAIDRFLRTVKGRELREQYRTAGDDPAPAVTKAAAPGQAELADLEALPPNAHPAVVAMAKSKVYAARGDALNAVRQAERAKRLAERVP